MSGELDHRRFLDLAQQTTEQLWFDVAVFGVGELDRLRAAGVTVHLA